MLAGACLGQILEWIWACSAACEGYGGHNSNGMCGNTHRGYCGGLTILALMYFDLYVWLCVSQYAMHVLTLSCHLEWQVAPAGEEAPVARGNPPRVGYPPGSMVELFHPDHDTEIVGKGRCGKHCTTEDISEEYRELGAQSVTVTECLKEGVPLILDMDNEPRLENLDDAVGYRILWPMMYLQRVLRPT